MKNKLWADITAHALARCVERSQERKINLGFVRDYKRIILNEVARISEIAPLVTYLSKHLNRRVVIIDHVSGITLVVKPQEPFNLVIISFGYCDEQHYLLNNNSTKHRCWLYETAFVYATQNGNVTKILEGPK